MPLEYTLDNEVSSLKKKKRRYELFRVLVLTEYQLLITWLSVVGDARVGRITLSIATMYGYA